jgi:hypothetical protein
MKDVLTQDELFCLISSTLSAMDIVEDLEIQEIELLERFKDRVGEHRWKWYEIENNWYKAMRK